MVVAILLTVGGLLMVMPFAWMILSSFKTEGEVNQIPPTIWSQHFSMENFKILFDSMAFGTYLANTLLIVLASFAGLFLNAMAGYGFAKFNFKGRGFLFYLVLVTMIFRDR
jgi:multiple sugar transport system permease protein